MADPKTLLDDIRIASPCTANWNEMTGTDSVRFCGECKLNVYNLSNMTSAEAADLVGRTEGRLCVRLYRRKDGTTITKDCPVGLRAAVRRATRAAGAVLTAVFGLFSGVVARTAWADAPEETCSSSSTMTVAESEEPPVVMGKIAAPRRAAVRVAAVDDNGVAIPDASVTLTDLKTGNVITAQLDEDGKYVFDNVPPGIYALNAMAEGHETPLAKTVRVARGQSVEISVTLPAYEQMLMGGIAPE